MLNMIADHAAALRLARTEGAEARGVLVRREEDLETARRVAHDAVKAVEEAAQAVTSCHRRVRERLDKAHAAGKGTPAGVVGVVLDAIHAGLSRTPAPSPEVATALEQIHDELAALAAEPNWDTVRTAATAARSCVEQLLA